MFKTINNDRAYRKALSRVFILHVIMFCIAFTAAIIGRSSSVLADSLDFIGDAMNYAVSMLIVNRSIMVRSTIAITKAVTMLGFGLPVMIFSLIRVSEGSVPDYEVMTWAGVIGIISHLYCISVLYKFRSGDSNRLSVWICTINDLLSNIITLIASQMVRFTGSIIPDIVAASVIVGIAIIGAIVILKQAIQEIKIHKANKGYA